MKKSGSGKRVSARRADNGAGAGRGRGGGRGDPAEPPLPRLAPAGASGWKPSFRGAREGRLGSEILRERHFQGDLEKPLCGAQRRPALHLREGGRRPCPSRPRPRGGSFSGLPRLPLCKFRGRKSPVSTEKSHPRVTLPEWELGLYFVNVPLRTPFSEVLNVRCLLP